ncbi:hypothetical protein JY651_03865 [Pyxidicoccus parkwayensis]|uniref:RNA polymerase sigma-70 region 2 domain-containing protein n=1 Tax=Pyxidicoccus parkwayensis TaxID=2813578 RepID=A0ABX7NZH1_9BACT|nr:sigma-70 family RNA polymerase sigma factor [Pyxidicoccus parkwaysis]QSQ24123.1 hypothetical protein JY651_03865 [Pyxidicoccus parkwaysis]
MGTTIAARQLVEHVERQAPLSVDLACLASFAVRVDPSLLRQLRLGLLPESSPAVEADLWQGSLVTFRSPDGFVFAPGVGAVLRERLATRNPERYEQAWNITRQAHESWLPPALRLEEELNYVQSSPNPEVFGRARKLLRQAVAELIRNPAGVAPWAAGATTRLSSDLMDMEEGRMLAVAARTHVAGNLLAPSLPSGPLPEWMNWLSLEGMERIKLAVRMFPRAIEFTMRAEPNDEVIEVPRTHPLVVEVADVEKHKPPPKPRRVFIDSIETDEQNRMWCNRIEDSLRQTQHQTFLVDKPIPPGGFVSKSTASIIAQCDAFIILLSDTEHLAGPYMQELRRSLRKRSTAEVGRLTLILVHTTQGNAPLKQTSSWPDSTIQRQVLIEARTGKEQHVTRRIVEVLEARRKSVTNWKRFDLAPTGPMRIPIVSGALRLRTLLGDEYFIEPATTPDLQPVPPPVDGPVVHPRELDLLVREVSLQTSLVAISGNTGTGKTQLVRQLLSRTEPAFPHGRYVLDLRRLGGRPSALTIAREVVNALAPEREPPGEDILQRYHALTSERRVALVLEDIDTLQWSDRQISRELNALRPYRPGTLLVTTSRAPIEGINAPGVKLEEVETGSARSLLLSMAPQIGAHAAKLVEMLGHLPMLLHEVGVAISQLPSDLGPARYVQLLQAVSLLTVFPSSFDIHAAAAVLASIGAPSMSGSVEATSLLREMIRAGLLKSVAHGRYALWRPIRQVAPRWLSESHTATIHHGSYFLTLLEGLHGQYMQGGRARAEAIATFDTESENIAHAIESLLAREPLADWEITACETQEASLRTAASTLVRLRSPPAERVRWFRGAAKFNYSEDPSLLLEVAIAQAELGHIGQAVETCGRARALMPVASDDAVRTGILVKLARFQMELDDNVAARTTLRRVQNQAAPSSAHRAEFHYVSSSLSFKAGSTDIAEPLLKESLALAIDAGDIRLEVDARLGLALIAAERSELSRAAALCEEALEFARAWRDDRGVALASWELGKVRLRQNVRESAGELLQVLVDHYRAIGHARAKQAAQEREELLNPNAFQQAELPPTDPMASVDIFQKYSARIVRRLIAELRCSDDTAFDSTIDAIFSYLQQPERYDPNRGRLETYLLQSARNKATDRMRSESARARRELAFAGVAELQTRSPKEELELSVEAKSALDLLASKGGLSDKDLATLRLLLLGEGSTKEVAKAMGLESLSEEALRLAVKRQRDRLMKRLERFGKENFDDS